MNLLWYLTPHGSIGKAGKRSCKMMNYGIIRVRKIEKTKKKTFFYRKKTIMLYEASMNTWFISYHDHLLITGLVIGSILVILNPNWGLVLVPCWLCYGDINHMVVDFDGVYIAGVRWLSPAYRLSKPLVEVLKWMMSIQSPSKKDIHIHCGGSRWRNSQKEA